MLFRSPSADSGNDRTANQNEFRLGLLTAQEFFAAKDQWWEEQYDQRYIEIDVRLKHAEALVAAHPELELLEAYQLLEQRFPNLPSEPADPANDSPPKADA